MQHKTSSVLMAEQDIVDQFEWLDDWQQKYGLLIDWGKKLPALPEVYQQPAYLIRGCQSQVWMVLAVEDQKLTIEATSDAMIVRGLIALMRHIYHQKPLAEICDYSHGFVDRLGLTAHLSPTRSNGLNHMLQHIIQCAADLS